jgi:hypothetical protein
MDSDDDGSTTVVPPLIQPDDPTGQDESPSYDGE